MGYIHSIESLGLLDGPGLRCVVFMQGCAIRCIYCHNPDTWQFGQAESAPTSHLQQKQNSAVGKRITVDELMQKIIRFKPYFDKSGGGVTFSGGEPLMQPDFLLEVLKKCKHEGIHTAIDTAGVGTGDYKDILSYTDLVIFDIKHTDKNKYREITGVDKKKADEFVECLKMSGCDVWIKTVIIPGINDALEYIADVRKEAAAIPNVRKYEFLPYHVLGVNKYEQLGIDYPLKGVPAMSKEELDKLVENGGTL